MLNVRVITSREDFHRTPEKSRKEVSKWLRELVATGIGGERYTSEDVRVLWSPFEEGYNAPDLAIDVFFSARSSGLNPPVKQIQHMIENILTWFRRTPLLSDFKDFAVWVWPSLI